MARRDVQERPESRHSDHRHEITERDRTYQLSAEDIALMRTVGTFRAVRREDIEQSRIGRLSAFGLVENKNVYPKTGQERLDVVVLTKEGRRILTDSQPLDDLQRFYAGLVKPNELAHDAAIYPAYLKEVEEIEAAGGTVHRAVMDYELKGQVASEMNREKGEPGLRKIQLAAEMNLPVVDGKVLFPDLRIEYTDEHGIEQHKDIEIVTEHYRGSRMAGKKASGFKLVGKEGRKHRVHDEPAKRGW